MNREGFRTFGWTEMFGSRRIPGCSLLLKRCPRRCSAREIQTPFYCQRFDPVFLAGMMRTRDAMLSFLRADRPVIAPSMLKCDFGNLRRECERLDAAGAALLHLDVMDANFVPNLSYGPMVIERMRELTATPFDAHLMIADPARYLDEYIKAGCEAITFHLEAVPQPVSLLREIRKRNVVAGLAINPETPFSAAEPFLSECDLFLVMSVHPGFGGQKFIPDVLSKVTQARSAAGPDLIISMDGGVSRSTIAACARAGTDVFVAGSSVFDESDYAAAVADLRTIANEAR
jgi:ribulose-phosphate 3-epimerase